MCFKTLELCSRYMLLMAPLHQVVMNNWMKSLEKCESLLLQHESVLTLYQVNKLSCPML